MLTLLKQHDITTILEQSTDDTIKNNIDNLLSLTDDGNLSNGDIATLKNYITQCANNNNDVSNYYMLEYTPVINIYKKLCDFRGYSIIRLLTDAIYKLSYDNNQSLTDDNSALKQAMLTILNGVKGVRDNQDALTLINKFLDTTQYLLNNGDYVYLKNTVNDICTTTPKKYIVSVSNTPLSQLTSSYSINYNSCYNFISGEYRSSNVYLMRDYRVYIVKIYAYNDDNLAMIDNDTLKISSKVISRFNYCMDGVNVAVAKNYGDSSYYNNNIDDYIALSTEIITQVNNYTPELYSDDNDGGITYSYDFIGYQDFKHNLRLTTSECNIRNIGDNDNVSISWDIDDSDYIIHDTCPCCYCCDDRLYSEDDRYYCEDIDDYTCENCCWWSDYDNCYYSNNTSYIRTPDGTYYRYDACDIN